MSWSLSLDRAPRSRKPTSYSDTSRYKEASNDDDNISKKKRGRPPRTNGQDTVGDGAPPPKRRGRPPKFPRPQTPNNNNSQKANDESKTTKYKLSKKYETSSSSQSKSSSSDIDDKEYYSVDYAYEYEYEYDSENTTKEEKPPNPPPAISTPNPINPIDINQIKPPKPAIQPKSSLFPLRTNKKISKAKSKAINDSTLQKTENDYIIQEIIGQRDILLEPKSTPNQYFVKFQDMPYNYCRWLTPSQISKYEGGETSLKKFIQKCDSNKLVNSISIPHLLIFPDTEILTQWFEVDRIFGESVTVSTVPANQNNSQTQSSNQPEETKSIYEYLVKWKELDYDSFSVESLDGFKNTASIGEYKCRLLRMNPKKIPTRWVHPIISQLVKVTQKPISKKGEIFHDFQLEGLNWLIECWYEKRFSIFGDMTREGKLPELICMLNFLSSQFQINGPFLVLASENQVLSWKENFENWSNLNVVVLGGNSSSRQITIDHEVEVRDDHGRLIPDYVRFDVLLTSYETFLSNSQNLMEIDWRYVITDDGYKMKNSRGRIRNSLKLLKYEHITLSMEWEMLKPKNDYQIYFLMNFINPQNFNDINHFAENFVPYEGEKMVKLNKIIQPFLLSRDVDMIKEKMRPKEETVIIVQPSIIQRRLYIEAVKNKTEILMKPITDQADIPLTQLITLLRQLVDHPILTLDPDNDNEVANMKSNLISTCGKMHFLDVMLKEVVPQKKRVMIFSQFIRVFDFLELYLNDMKYRYEKIDTMTSADDRIMIINRYMSSEDTSIFLFSSKPGSYEIDVNLFDYVVIYDKDNYCFHREMRGTLYRLVTNGSFEMNRSGKIESVTSFDEQTLPYLIHSDYRQMDAEDIELMLRDSIKPMFDKSEDKITSFFTKSYTEILRDCVKTPDMYKEDNTAIVDLQKQKKFWNELLKPPQQQKKDSSSVAPDPVTRAKQLIFSLIDHGYQGGIDQLDLLKCALTLAPPENPQSLQYLKEIVGDNSSDTPVHRFGSSAFLIDKLASRMFDNVVFFARLKRALFYATREDLKWPSSSSSSSSSSNSKESQLILKDFSIADEYALMYAIDQHGTKQFSSSFEKAKDIKFKQVEKRILNIIEFIENQFSVTGGFPQLPKNEEASNDNNNEYDTQSEQEYEDSKMRAKTFFVPMTPEEWCDRHPSLIVRDTLNEDEFNALFKYLKDFGIPTLKEQYEADIKKIMSKCDISQVKEEAIEECIRDIIEVSLSHLNSKDDRKSSKYDQLLNRSEIKHEEFLNVISVCRMMSKVYSFLKDHEIDTSKEESNEQMFDKLRELFERVPLSEKVNRKEVTQFFFCLIQFGVNDTDSWSSEGNFTGFPETVESRLLYSSKIIDEICSPKVIKSTTNLNIFNFGKIVDLPSFNSKNIAYPVGFLSTRQFKISNDQISTEKLYRCEIQSVVFFPLFVVTVLGEESASVIEGVDRNPIESWKAVLGALVGYNAAAEILNNMGVSGEWLFGLTHPDIIEDIEEMDKQASVNKYQEENQQENKNNE